MSAPKTRGVPAARWFYGQPGFHSPLPVPPIRPYGVVNLPEPTVLPERFNAPVAPKPGPRPRVLVRLGLDLARGEGRIADLVDALQQAAKDWPGTWDVAVIPASDCAMDGFEVDCIPAHCETACEDGCATCYAQRALVEDEATAIVDRLVWGRG